MPKLWNSPTEIRLTAHRKEALKEVIQGLIEGNRLPEDFTLIDLCCGRADESVFLSLEFPKSHVTAVDTTRYKEWSSIPSRVTFIVQDILEFFKENPVYPVDIVLFLDTYRNFSEISAPEIRVGIDEWLKANARYMLSSGDQTFRSEKLPYKDTQTNVLKLVYPKEG
jgi:hypothetical protein